MDWKLGIWKIFVNNANVFDFRKNMKIKVVKNNVSFMRVSYFVQYVNIFKIFEC